MQLFFILFRLRPSIWRCALSDPFTSGAPDLGSVTTVANLTVAPPAHFRAAAATAKEDLEGQDKTKALFARKNLLNIFFYREQDWSHLLPHRQDLHKEAALIKFIPVERTGTLLLNTDFIVFFFLQGCLFLKNAI